MHTFDYETYIRSSGTVRRCMIEPTERLLSEFSHLGGKASFFIDTTFLHLLERDAPQEFRQVANQLAKAKELGHELELHLHPSWKDAKPTLPGRWETEDLHHYSLFSLPQSEVDNLFQQGIEILQLITKPIDSNYQPMAFRAGGWSIGDGMAVSSAMRKFGIKIDSSVAPGMYREKNPVQHYDFRHASVQEPYWRFSSNPAQADMSGDLVEIPISTYPLNPLSTVIRKLEKIIWKKMRPELLKVYGDGQGISLTDFLSPAQRLRDKFRSTLVPKRIMHTLQAAFPGEMDRFLKGCTTSISISHPKNLSETSFNELRRLAERGWHSISLRDYYHRIQRETA